MQVPPRTRIENAAVLLTLLFGIVWLVLGVVALPASDGEISPDVGVPLMAAVPAIAGAAWALVVGHGRRAALGLGMGTALVVVVVYQLTPVTFVTPLAVLLLLTADATQEPHISGPSTP